MAIATRLLASFEDGSCRWEMDYDDVDLRVRTFRCVNNSGRPTTGTLARADGTQARAATVAAGQSQEVTVTTMTATRIQLTTAGLLAGRVSGHLATFSWG